MIIGLGSDLCNIDRIQKSLDRFGERFIARVFTDVERARAEKRPFTRAGTYAKRFAAKEAFSKAVGLGMRMPMTWRLCEIANLPSGQPVIRLHGGLKDWFDAQGLSAHVSVTDESDYAASFVVVERPTPTP